MGDAPERWDEGELPAELVAALGDARGDGPSAAECARIEAAVLAAVEESGVVTSRAASEAHEDLAAGGTPVSGGGVLTATLVGIIVLGVAWWSYDLGQPRLERSREVRETVERRSARLGSGALEADAGPRATREAPRPDDPLEGAPPTFAE